MRQQSTPPGRVSNASVPTLGSALLRRARAGCLVWLAVMTAVCLPAAARDLSTTIVTVKKSVVAIGSFQKTRSPAIRFTGTGFVTGDGLSVITNAHVIAALREPGSTETLGIVTSDGDSVKFRPATVKAIDREHDLAWLRLDGAPMPALRLDEGAQAAEGRALAFTGFPLGMVLGWHPATHRALLSAITPIVMPSLSSARLGAAAISQLQRDRFPVYQLDATAYPGNSGSPLYDPETGVVVGIINQVYVKGLKETAITAPSGITYAVPVVHARALLRKE